MCYHSRSVREKQGVQFEGTYWMQFLLTKLYFSLIFICVFLLSAIDYRTLITLLCRYSRATLTRPLLLWLAPAI